jgi:hypothetical protein
MLASARPLWFESNATALLSAAASPNPPPPQVVQALGVYLHRGDGAVVERTNDSRAEENGDESLQAQLITLVQQVPPAYLPALVQLVQALILGVQP